MDIPMLPYHYKSAYYCCHKEGSKKEGVYTNDTTTIILIFS